MPRAFSLAGFEVDLIGRFWVTAEGVHCKSCGNEIEIDDDYVRGIRGVQMAANLYMHLSTKAKVAASRIRPWRKTLTCENPACRETHTYGTDDLCLYGA